ncbi:ABC transporter permease [Natronolimnobius sp. AArcel1]|uniref:ABC transporter permease n=1 Tax=Natronolimnobius sp. AArcel1 TaxID=1679093 RepID=UPI0013EE16CC|nr:ABC transporter permease [Natronolimnobius sp. AArcel1]NGM70377.1 ABC transporter permease [Natronolimnobius sp. AArcel1]
MKRYLVERTVQLVCTIFAVMTLTFFLIRLLPGGPADALRANLLQNNPEMSADQINRRVEAQLNIMPDEPLYIQYVSYVSDLLRGDMGESMSQGSPVTEVIANAAPWTIFFIGTGVTVAFVLGISSGAIMAYREGSRFDSGSTVTAILMNSIPDYIYGLIFLWLLSYQLEVFPTGGRYSSTTEATVTPLAPIETLTFFGDALWHAALPITSIVLVAWGGWALGMRGNSIQILGEDYLRVARLRGLPQRRIALRYVGRNAVLPMYTSMLITIGFLLGGSIIIEQVFSYPGMGYYMIEALQQRDYPLMMGVFLVITITVAIAVYIADLTYGLIDPRASVGDIQ